MDEQPTQPTGSIAEELNRLGQTLTETIKLAWQSEERRRIEQDVAEGFRKLSLQIDEAMKSAAESSGAKDVSSKATNAWETAHGPQILAEMRAGLLESLQKLNAEMDRRVQQAKTPPAKPEVEDATPNP